MQLLGKNEMYTLLHYQVTIDILRKNISN